MDFEESSEQLDADLDDRNIFSSPVLASKSESDVLWPGYKEELTTKRAIELLIAGTLKSKVCRYCLNIVSSLSELDQILQIAGTGVLHKVTIRDMVASFYPFKVEADPNFPNKICNKCLNRTISAYLFTQQCERSERALRNCFDDMYDKLNKLDSIERPKRGRQKRNPNYNTLYAEHNRVIDYAEPIINIVNTKSVSLSTEPAMSDLECPKCWQLFTKIEDLILHEKSHPSNMWYNCRLCGKSFVKRVQFRRHMKQTHTKPDMLPIESNDDDKFECKICDSKSQDYSTHLQHMEKHKFQTILEHLIEKDTDKLCTVCMDKSPKLIHLDKMVRLHGGYPGATGDMTLYSILGSTLPDMNSPHSYIGTKICEKCLNNAITAYVFINHFIYSRDRLNICITSMLDSLNKIDEPEGNIFMEIAKESILPIKEENYFDENLLLDEDDVDENKLKVDVLEDEFRKPDSEEEETNSEPEIKNYINTFLKEDVNSKSSVQNSEDIDIFDDYSVKRDIFSEIDNPAKLVTKTYSNRRLVNGYQVKCPSDNEGYNSLDDVSEFLTFKKKKKPMKQYYKYKYRCPMCNKAFLTDFHLQRHIQKHLNQRVECKICNAPFKSKFFLHEHIRMVHILDKILYFACKVCGRSFESEEKVKSHENFHLNVQCQLCYKVFVTQKLFESHLRRHGLKMNRTKLSNQICSFCEKDYTNDNKLSIHVNKVHLQIKPYSCDMCERQFYTEHNLSKHKKIHDMKTKETCELCRKKFSTRKGMVVHLRKHTGETPHRCPLCGKAFYSESKAKRHMKNYHGGTLYCKLCKCVFSCKNDLKTHVIMVHNHNALL